MFGVDGTDGTDGTGDGLGGPIRPLRSTRLRGDVMGRGNAMRSPRYGSGTRIAGF
jgi:hypothetical protein